MGKCKWFSKRKAAEASMTESQLEGVNKILAKREQRYIDYTQYHFKSVGKRIGNKYQYVSKRTLPYSLTVPVPSEDCFMLAPLDLKDLKFEQKEDYHITLVQRVFIPEEDIISLDYNELSKYISDICKPLENNVWKHHNINWGTNPDLMNIIGTTVMSIKTPGIEDIYLRHLELPKEGTGIIGPYSVGYELRMYSQFKVVSDYSTEVTLSNDQR